MANLPRHQTAMSHERYMDTIVTIKTVFSSEIASSIDVRVTEAFRAFANVESVCSRFRPDSELRRLCSRPGQPVVVSELLYEAIRFAREMAVLTDGAFDPTIGHIMEQAGFDRNYVTGERTHSTQCTKSQVTFEDIQLDETNRTITLLRPLQLDLGAVAKGLAVDLAARSLTDLKGFAIDAGGDLLVSGCNERDEPWRVGIRHPVQHDENIITLQLSNAAVCTSGSYERISESRPDTHHLIDPRTGRSRNGLVSCTVIAPFAMMADACSTAAFMLGYEHGLQLLEEMEVDGLLISSLLELRYTSSFMRYRI